MTIRIVKRRGERRWVIDISYRTIDGKVERYRRDAQVQLREAAKAEHRRLEDELARAGTLVHVAEATTETEAEPITFAEAVRYARATHFKTALKPTTRIGYNVQLDTLLLPRFGHLPLEAIDRQAIALLDAELFDEGLAPSTRARFHIVLRSVFRTAVNAGMLAAMPALPKLPKSGRKAVNPMHRADLDAILAAAAPSARLACQLAAFAGLRAGEVRGLRWPDVDLDTGTLTIRRSISAGFETTPTPSAAHSDESDAESGARGGEAGQGQSLGARDHHGVRETLGRERTQPGVQAHDGARWAQWLVVSRPAALLCVGAVQDGRLGRSDPHHGWPRGLGHDAALRRSRRQRPARGH